MKKLAIAAVFIFLFSASAFSQDEIQYKKFKLENADCSAAVMYKVLPDEMEIGVSGIATGQGSEFRKWKVSDIRISVSGDKVRPDKEGKFFTRKESFFRVPAAVLFVAIGALSAAEGSDLGEGIASVGMAAGLGLLALQAHGDIAGSRCVFKLNKDTLEKLGKGKDAIEITVENEGMHLKYRIKIGILKPPIKPRQRFEYENMSQNELSILLTTLEGQVATLEKNQGSYQYGTDPEYDDIQHKLEKLEAERGMAYKTWLERSQIKDRK